MPTRYRKLSDQTGVTLLETIVAVVVSGIALATAMPSLSSALTAHQLKAALRTTTNYVRVVRSTAVARNQQARLAVSDDGLSLSTQVLSGGAWTDVGSPVVLDGGVTVSGVTPVSGLLFNPQGMTNATTTINLTSSQGATYSVTVSILGSVEMS